MEKMEFIEDQVAKVQLGMVDAVRVGLQAAYEEGMAQSVPSVEDVTPFAQEDIDKAVFAAVEPLKAQIASLSATAEEREKLEETIAVQMAELASKISALTVLAPVAPVEESAPAPEQPVP